MATLLAVTLPIIAGYVQIGPDTCRLELLTENGIETQIVTCVEPVIS